jgi:hypothetical protein
MEAPDRIAAEVLHCAGDHCAGDHCAGEWDAALAAGDISPAHMHTAARAARHVDDLSREHEDVVLDAARAFAPDELRQVMTAGVSTAPVSREARMNNVSRSYTWVSV